MTTLLSYNPTGKPIDDLMERALERQRHAFRPGTIANRESAMKSLISFAVDMNFTFNRPKPEELCAYIELLAQRQMSPKGLRAHMSSLKSFFINAGYDANPFDSTVVSNALRAIDISIQHAPKMKQPLHPSTLARILEFIDLLPHGPMISFALSLMFTALLRQSNLLAKTVRTFDYERQLLVQNVVTKDALLLIDLKWTKTNQRFGESTVVTAPAIPTSTICPVSRFIRTQRKTDKLSRLPLIRFDDGNPMTVRYVSNVWKRALTALKITIPNMTLHRLRLSGASWASAQGASAVSICQQGTWRTDAFRAYIASFDNSLSEVNQAMTKICDQQ